VQRMIKLTEIDSSRIIADLIASPVARAR